MSKKDEKDLKAGEPVPEPTNAKVTNAEQPKFPKLFGLAMLLGPFVWLAPAGNVRNTLLPQYFSQIDPSGKVAAIAIMASVHPLLRRLPTFYLVVYQILPGPVGVNENPGFLAEPLLNPA